MDLKKYNLTGTRTAENLAKAFAGESQARNRYLFYAEIAKKEGFSSLEQVFLETGNEERGHAEIFFDYLTQGLGDTILRSEVIIPVAMSDTPSNLLSAAKGEKAEWSDLYPQFGQIAKQEGFDEIATSFFDIASVEHRHERRFRNLLERLQKNMLYSMSYEVNWMCGNCGYILTAMSAPTNCPACHHPQDYFRVFCYDVVKI